MNDMRFLPASFPDNAFQRPVTSEQISAMCRHVFGAEVEIVSALELDGGMYNNTYLIEMEKDREVILRVAPESDRQYRIERNLMRNEYASAQFLKPLSDIFPDILAADFTHKIINRDYQFHDFLAGSPAREKLGHYSASQQRSFFRQMGEITRKVHAIHGVRFGSIINPQFDSWIETLIAFFADLIADTDDAGLDSEDIRSIAALLEKREEIFAEVTEPRLLHGDLWTTNILLEQYSADPVITGLIDNDRTLWGDPEADWSIYMASKKPGTERDAFWEGYGPRPSTRKAAQRSLFYQARHVGTIRLECHRLGNSHAIPETYRQMRTILDGLN